MRGISEGQRREVNRQLGEQRVDGFRRGAPASLLVSGLVAWLAYRAFDSVGIWVRIGPPLVVGATVASIAAASYVPAVRRRFDWLLVVIAPLLVIVIGLQAALTGGFGSPVAATLYLVWVFLATVSPLAPLPFGICALIEIATMVGIIEWLTPNPGSPGLFVVVSLGIGAFCLLGTYIREQNQASILLANRALADAREKLADLNAHLEERAEALAAEVGHKVQAQSQDLAAALRKLTTSEAQRALASGDLFAGRVEIERELGRGGMGTVYLGRDRLGGRAVALKLMRPQAGTDASAMHRFVAEVAAASAISHPGVVKPLHVDVTADGQLYYLMEHADGATLALRLRQGPMESTIAAAIGQALAEVLAAAHRHGVVHRDIKPGNIVLCPRPPWVRVLDFGLSKLMVNGPEDVTLTRTNAMLGTPRYMAPEQVDDAARAGPASDVYSLGLVIYELVVGRSPFRAANLSELCRAQREAVPLRLDELVYGVSPGLADIVARCLAKQPADRPTADEVAAALRPLARRTFDWVEEECRVALAPATEATHPTAAR